ncbi:protein lin-37 homolog [Cydia splendana]|uniref:protein lin-37 homolog n=1 Tax=Cydia splendana TaxID=1100963 RepID=UPI0028F4C98C
MRKRRRLLTTPMKNKTKLLNSGREENEAKDTARGRLKGALMDALEPAGEESDASSDHSPSKRERNTSQDHNKRERNASDDDDRYRRPSPPRQSYVLKLFDRSVDLSQFSEDSPLYPICRAWIANQPKANYKDFGKKPDEPPPEDSIELPGPEGPSVSRIPELIPEQKQRDKDNINLDYEEAPPPPPSALLAAHVARWGCVRRAWLEQAQRHEARYEATQQLLNSLNVSTL